MDPEYRQEFISSEIDIGLPMQLREMREARGLETELCGGKDRDQQPRFSLMESRATGNFSLNTLKKMAALFDAGPDVSFVPWGEMIDFVESMSHRRLSILSFGDERKRLALAYARQRDTACSGDHQLPLVFPTGASTQCPPPFRRRRLAIRTIGTKNRCRFHPNYLHHIIGHHQPCRRRKV